MISRASYIVLQITKIARNINHLKAASFGQYIENAPRLFLNTTCSGITAVFEQTGLIRSPITSLIVFQKKEVFMVDPEAVKLIKDIRISIQDAHSIMHASGMIVARRQRTCTGRSCMTAQRTLSFGLMSTAADLFRQIRLMRMSVR